MRPRAHKRRRSVDALWFAVAFGICASASAAVKVAIGAEFQVNSFTPYYQGGATVAATGVGDFVVAWNSESQDSYSFGVFARRLDAAGMPQATEFAVTSAPERQTYPAVAAIGADSFVVAWESSTFVVPARVFARHFDASGPLGAEFQVNLSTIGHHYHAKIAADQSGNFVVVWQSSALEGEAGVFGRRFDSLGGAVGGEFQVNTYTIGYQSRSSLAMDSATGSFVVVWVSYHEQDGSERGIFAQRFDPAGVPQAHEFQVNSYTEGDQQYPDVAYYGDGEFVVVWRGDQDADHGFVGVFAQRFDATGAPLGGEFEASSFTARSQDEPAVAGDGDGFVVAWSGYIGSRSGIFLRTFASSVEPLTPHDLVVDTYDQGRDANVSIAIANDGDFVIAWNSSGYHLEPIPPHDVFGRFYSDPVPLDVDADGTTDALTDGLLVVRFLFGLGGASLAGGAVAQDCIRCDALAITDYLTTLEPQIDVDGDASALPLSDGVLVLRFLFGFTGPTLTAGAVGVDCTRCEAEEIEAYLSGLV